MRKYILEETNWKAVKGNIPKVAILPWGATEAHNYHMPYGTDNYIAIELAAACAKLASERGAKVMVLPTIPYGVNTGQPDILLDMNLNPGTQFLILKDLIAVLYRQGIKKFVVLNTHGGNDFKQHLRELNLHFPGMLLTQCNWFKMPGMEDYFEDLGEHAGEVETSLMMHLYPNLVLPLGEAGLGTAKKFRVEALNHGWAWAERSWSKVTADTGIGNPAKSSAEKGERFFKFITEKISGFLVQLAAADLEDLYV
ncbi:MAG: creatininase family protein [Prolixibacteraceae bacterium]